MVTCVNRLFVEYEMFANTIVRLYLNQFLAFYLTVGEELSSDRKTRR